MRGDVVDADVVGTGAVMQHSAKVSSMKRSIPHADSIVRQIRDRRIVIDSQNENQVAIRIDVGRGRGTGGIHGVRCKHEGEDATMTSIRAGDVIAQSIEQLQFQRHHATSSDWRLPGSAVEVCERPIGRIVDIDPSQIWIRYFKEIVLRADWMGS